MHSTAYCKQLYFEQRCLSIKGKPPTIMGDLDTMNLMHNLHLGILTDLKVPKMKLTK